MLLLALAVAPSLALQRPQSGPTIELGVGPAMGARPAGFAAAGQLSLGWWFGPYDDDYALGRFWAVAATGRIDVVTRDGSVRLAPMLEIRRGMDLFVLAPHGFIAAGPLLADGGVGVTARAGGGLKFRRTRKLGFTGRLEAGVDYLAGSYSPVVGLTLGGGWSSPVGQGRSARR
jgi:hypothetical protein